ncbi:MAG: TetR/AcrR family transcriptional regulator [Candidatus Acidiferrales bacterium]
MPFPSKTDRNAILSAALEELSRGGIRDLSLRNIAATLGLAPNALYRYFSDRAALEAALADESARRLEVALRKAAHGLVAAKAIRKMAGAYLQFARDNRNLYEVSMSFHTPDHAESARQSLWSFTVEQVQRVTGETRSREAAVALWALLHGAATLEAGQVLGKSKPASGFEFGLNAWLLLAETSSSAPVAKKSLR